MSEAFYRKWRPHLWEEVVSQEHIVTTLQNAIRNQRFGHAYLFAGPRGTGKTSTARLLAKAVNCLAEDPANRPCDRCDHCVAVNENRFLDLIEIDAASNTSVDDVRELRDKINFSPSQGKYKVYIIDEVHMLSTAAFNALLKTLEEPPAHAIFILATTEVHKIPATVLSRCQRHEFRRIPMERIIEHLSHLCTQEKLEVDPQALALIARHSTGAMRDAISLLDQLSTTGGRITLQAAQEVLGTAVDTLVLELVDAVIAQDAAAGFATIHRALNGGADPRQFARQVVDYLRSVMMVQMGSLDQVDATDEQRERMERHAHGMDTAWLLHSVRLFNTAATEVRQSWQPSLLLELAVSEAVEGAPAASVERPAVQPRREAPPRQQAATQPQPQQEPPARQSTVSTPPVNTSATQTRQANQPPAQAAPRQEATAQTQGTSQPAASQSGVASLEDISKSWKRIKQLVKERSKPVEALLNSCKLVTVKDGVLILGFQGDVLKDKMSAPENLELVGEVIESVLHTPVRVTCIVMTGKSGGLPDDLDVEGDGMVGTALNLGGTIVHKD